MGKYRNQTEEIFFELVRAGLWEKEVRLAPYGEVDYSEVLRLAEEQSVVGLVAAGLENVVDVKVPQAVALQFVDQTLQIEQRNKAMNAFVAEMFKVMGEAGVSAVLVKGQGVAQCYEKPLWRASGDVDFFLSEENFLLAREFLRPLVEDGFDPKGEDARNISASLDGWAIELHGNQFTGLSAKIDRGLKVIHDSIFYEGNVRSWMDGKTQVFLPGVDEDVIIVFTHFLKHFYKGGLGLRQICDWCKLLWTYRDNLKKDLLEKRLRAMGLMTEWKAFAAYAVDYLGMPVEAMPLLNDNVNHNANLRRKAERINAFVMEVGNMGHNRDNGFYGNKSFMRRKIGAFGRRIGDLCRHAMIFPLDSVRFFPSIILNGIKSAAKGVG